MCRTPPPREGWGSIFSLSSVLPNTDLNTFKNYVYNVNDFEKERDSPYLETWNFVSGPIKNGRREDVAKDEPEPHVVPKDHLGFKKENILAGDPFDNEHLVKIYARNVANIGISREAAFPLEEYKTRLFDDSAYVLFGIPNSPGAPTTPDGVTIPLKDLSCNTDTDIWVNWWEAENDTVIDVNNCLWKMEDGPEKKARLKTLALAQSLLRGLYEGTVTADDVRKRLEDNGFVMKSELDALIRQINTPVLRPDSMVWGSLPGVGAIALPGLDSPGRDAKLYGAKRVSVYDDDVFSSLYAAYRLLLVDSFLIDPQGELNIASFTADTMINDTELFLLELTRKGLKLGLDYNEATMPPPLTAEERSALQDGDTPEALAKNREIVDKAYFELFTKKRSFDDYPEATAYLDKLGISWRGGEYVGKPTTTDVYATLLAFIGDQALRPTAQFNSAPGSALIGAGDNAGVWTSRDVRSLGKVISEAYPMPELLMNSYEAIAKSANALPKCSEEKAAHMIDDASVYMSHDVAHYMGLVNNEYPANSPSEESASYEAEAIVGTKRLEKGTHGTTRVEGVIAPTLDELEGCDIPPTTDTTTTPPASTTDTATTPSTPNTTATTTTPATTPSTPNTKTTTTTPATTPSTPNTTATTTTPATTPSTPTTKTTTETTTPTTSTTRTTTTTTTTDPKPSTRTTWSTPDVPVRGEVKVFTPVEPMSVAPAPAPQAVAVYRPVEAVGPIVDTGGHVEHGWFTRFARAIF